MKLHLSLIRTLPARLTRGLLVAAHRAAAMMDPSDAVLGGFGKYPCDEQIEAGGNSFCSAALAGSGRM